MTIKDMTSDDGGGGGITIYVILQTDQQLVTVVALAVMFRLFWWCMKFETVTVGTEIWQNQC